MRALSHSSRGRKLLEYLLEHGEASTYDIETVLGEAHAPSAVRDLRDRGVPVVLVRREQVNGKQRGVYQLDPTAPLHAGMIGRTGISKQFKDRLIEHYGARCRVCGTEYKSRYLQPDHRIPQRVGGDELDSQRRVESYMPLCGPDNRAKSYECERCPNWTLRDPDVCRRCYWAFPEDYDHVATKPERRETIVWSGDKEIGLYRELSVQAKAVGMSIANFIKSRLSR